MDAREATYSEVEETLERPFSVRSARGRRHNYFRAIDGFSIRVTVVQRIRLVITVWKEPM
jgi:hypothetical protein